jgi:hypothetical protein
MAEVITDSSDIAGTNSDPIVMKLNNVTVEELRALNENFNIKFKHCTACKQFKWFHQFHSKKMQQGWISHSMQEIQKIDW